MQASNFLRKATFVNINGQLKRKNKAFISIEDRGFRFGDGVFETIRIENANPYRLPQHLERLQRSLEATRIPSDVKQLKDQCYALIRKNACIEGFLRIAVSRGEGSQGYLPTYQTPPTTIIEIIKGITPVKSPLHLWLSSYEKPSPKSLPIHVKTAQGLNATLARIEAKEHNCHEALLFNHKGYICEGTSANIFWFNRETLHTPSLACGVLPGIIRQTITELSPFPVIEGEYTLNDLQQANEVFMTNVNWLLAPVASIQPGKLHWTVHQKTLQLLEIIRGDILRS